jgi:hypothetical protein
MSLRPIAQIYFTRKGFCPGRGCVPIVIDEASRHLPRASRRSNTTYCHVLSLETLSPLFGQR